MQINNLFSRGVGHIIGIGSGILLEAALPQMKNGITGNLMRDCGGDNIFENFPYVRKTRLFSEGVLSSSHLK